MAMSIFLDAYQILQLKFDEGGEEEHKETGAIGETLRPISFRHMLASVQQQQTNGVSEQEVKSWANDLELSNYLTFWENNFSFSFLGPWIDFPALQWFQAWTQWKQELAKNAGDISGCTRRLLSSARQILRSLRGSSDQS